MLQPTVDYIFLTIEEKKESGIILSDISQDKQPIGRVEAVGPEVKNINVGDRIIFNAFLLKELNLDGKKICLLKEKDIYATCPKK